MINEQQFRRNGVFKTNTLDRKELELKMELEEKEKINELENELHSCCSGTTDRRLLRFMSQLTLGFTVMSFCMYKLIDSELDCNEKTVYTSILTSTLTLFFPSPSSS